MTGGQAVLGVSWASVSLATVLVSLRLYSRASRKALSWDDYTITVAFGTIRRLHSFQLAQAHLQRMGYQLLIMRNTRLYVYLDPSQIPFKYETVADNILNLSIRPSCLNG